MISYFLKQNIKVKLLLISLSIAILYGINISVKLAISEYRQYKFIKKEIKRHTTQIDSLKLEQIRLLDKGKTINYKAKRKSNNIDAKLKQDEKDIDNSIIDDNKRNEFLSKYD